MSKDHDTRRDTREPILSRLFVFDPIFKKHAELENSQGIWSFIISHTIYYARSKKHAELENSQGIWSFIISHTIYNLVQQPTSTVEYGASRGLDCLWRHQQVIVFLLAGASLCAIVKF